MAQADPIPPDATPGRPQAALFTAPPLPRGRTPRALALAGLLGALLGLAAGLMEAGGGAVSLPVASGLGLLATLAVWRLIHLGRVVDAAREAENRAAMLERMVAALRDVYDEAPLGIAVTTPELVILDANDGLARFVGRSRAALIGTRLTEFADPRHRAANEALIREFEAGRLDRLSVTRPVRRPDGAMVWLDILMTTVRHPDRNLMRLTLIAADATELTRTRARLQEAEGQIQALLSLCPAPASLSRIGDGAFLAANDRFLDLVGWSRAELIGRTSVDLGLWGQVDHRSSFLAGLGGTGERRDLRLQIRHRSGRAMTLTLAATRVTHEDQDCLLAVVEAAADGAMAPGAAQSPVLDWRPAADAPADRDP